MTAVFVVRHPETTWNEEQRYQGRLESPLSSNGKTQPTAVAGAFAGQNIEVVYSSPLGRALDLANAVADAAGVLVKIDHRLTELGQCPWEGKRLQEIQKAYPQLYETWYTSPDEVTFPDGENLGMLQSRALSFLADVYKAHPATQVVVVTHSVVIMVMVASALCLELRHIHNIRLANCAITTFCGQEAPGTLMGLNDVDPLYHSPVASAEAQGCATWTPRRVTQ
jgi:phosphoserine phosphatase